MGQLIMQRALIFSHFIKNGQWVNSLCSITRAVLANREPIFTKFLTTVFHEQTIYFFYKWYQTIFVTQCCLQPYFYSFLLAFPVYNTACFCGLTKFADNKVKKYLVCLTKISWIYFYPCYMNRNLFDWKRFVVFFYLISGNRFRNRETWSARKTWVFIECMLHSEITFI